MHTNAKLNGNKRKPDIVPKPNANNKIESALLASSVMENVYTNASVRNTIRSEQRSPLEPLVRTPIPKAQQRKRNQIATGFT